MKVSALFMILLIISMIPMGALMSNTSLAMESGKSVGDSNSSFIKMKDRVEKADVKRKSTPEIFERRYPTSTNATSVDFKDEWGKWVNTTDFGGNTTRLIVGLSHSKTFDLAKFNEILAGHGAEVVGNVSIKGELRAIVVELPSKAASHFIENIRMKGLARYVEPDMKVKALFTPNDPYWSLQWGPRKIEADWAWNTTVGNSSILVAVVDTGVDYTHPDLAANYVALGYDWVNHDSDPLDDFGHGTHCAGIIAAVLNNSIGIAGLAQIRIMAEKVLDNYGWGWWDWVANGIIHATDCGAKIISLSLGGYGESELLHEAVKYAYDSGVLIVAAAGNDNTNMKFYPAGYDEVVAVTATDEYDNKAWFSNWGDWVELAAPGVNIYSTMPTYYVTMNDWGYPMNYSYMSGTSMACPHVAGVAALVWSLYPNKTRDWVRLWLRYTADDLGDPGFDVYYGYGRINARKAVEWTPPLHELIAYMWETPPYIEPGASGVVNATILNFGESDETNVEVQLLANDTVVNSTSIGYLASGSLTTVSLAWTPTVEGTYNITLYVVPVPGEVRLENNALSKYIYVGFPVKAVVLHSAGNFYGEIITNWQVLTCQWYLFGVKMPYIDYTTLNKDYITYEDINATGADVLIISCAYDPWMGWEFTDSEIEAIRQYVEEGHGLIVTAGTLYYWVPNNNKLAPLLGLNETTMWDVAWTDLLHLLNITHPLFAGVPNPLVFPSVGTAIPSDRRWDGNELFGGKYQALGHYQESAIVTYRGLVYISPWLEIIPPYYYHHLKLLYNAIMWSRYQKPAHELVVSLEAPKALKPNQSALLNASVTNEGLNNETNIELKLFISGQIVKSVNISQLIVGESYKINYTWTPSTEGLYNVTAYATVVPGEDNVLNNVKSAKVIVSKRILALCEDDYPWMYPSNEEALDLYNVPYVVIRSSDFGRVDLSVYTKVIIASDQPQSFYDAVNNYRGWFEEYVQNGGVLEIHAACWGWHGGGWIGPLPGGLQYNWYFSNDVTVVDHTHPVMTTPNPISDNELDGWWWSVHGYLSNYPHDSRIVIIETDTQQPVYIEFDYGAGTIIASSQTLEWAYRNYKLGYEWFGRSRILENSLLYLSTRYEHDLSVGVKAYMWVPIGSSTWINATVKNRGLNNETNVQIYLFINDVLVNSETVPKLACGESYTLTYSWTPTVEGVYNVTAYAPPVENETYLANNVATMFVTVAEPMIRPLEGQYANYTFYYIDSSTGERYFWGFWNFTYLRYISPYQINVTMNGYWYGWVVVNIFTRRVESDSGIYWRGMYYPFWIETNITIGSTIKLAWGEATVVDNEVIYYNGRPIDCWELRIKYYGARAVLYYDKASGLCMGMKETEPWGGIYQFMLFETNVPLGFAFQHDLTVTLEIAPSLPIGKNATINATVYNTGLSNESNVMLELSIDGVVVANANVKELPVAANYTLNYSWTPSKVGVYTISAYARPVAGEEYTENNYISKEVQTFIPYIREYLPHQWVGDGIPMGWYGDDACFQYILPFNFTFYGVNYSTIYISTNGLITFEEPDWSWSNSLYALAGKLAIAPAWDDWVTWYPHDIYIWQNETHVGIRWDVAACYNWSIVANFEAILSKDGTIQFNYEFSNGTVSATVGISNGQGDIIAEDLTDLNCINSIIFKPSAVVPIPTIMWINPPVTNATISGRFNVTLEITNVTDLYIWTADIQWNPTIMNLTGFWEGPFLKQGGQTMFLWAEVNYTGGYIKQLTCTLLGNVPGVNGSGVLATLEFEGLAEGSSLINVSNVGLMNSSGEDIQALVVGGVAHITRPLPELYVESITWPYPEPILYANTTTYNINVTIANGGNLDAGPFNVTFTAIYSLNGENITEFESKITVPGLAAGNSTVVKFGFKPLHKGVYYIAIWVDSDNNVEESNEINNITMLTVKVRLAGDVDGDHDVDYRDLFKLARAYGSTPSDENWNCHADFNADGHVDYRDLFLLAKNYGKIDP